MWRSRKSRGSNEISRRDMATLVKSSQISEEEIHQLHADFLDHYPSGRLNKKTFTEYFQKFQPSQQQEIPPEQIFDMIDVNKDGTIDFNELLVITVLQNRVNTVALRLGFAFDMWDGSGDGFIDKSELADVITAIYDLTGAVDRKGERDPKKRAKEIIAQLDVDHDKKLSKEEFISGCEKDPVIRDLLAPNA